MEVLVKGQSSLYAVEEVTEAVYVAPTLDEHGIEPEEDNIEFTLEREKIERNTLTDTIETVAPRLGLRTVTGSVGIELKAGKVAGSKPRGSIFYKSLLGGERIISTSTTTGEDHTTTVINLEDADANKYRKNDVILIKEAGKFAARPIASVDNTLGSVSITLAIPLDEAPSDNVVIEKVLIYHHDTNSKAFSITYHDGGEIRTRVWGMKSLSASLTEWEANKTPKMSFSLEGVDIAKDMAAPAVVTDFSTDAMVPVMQGAYAWLGQEPVEYVKVDLSIENTKADLPSAASKAGKIGTRKTKFATTGAINPYMSADNLDRWDNFENGTTTSLFFYAYNPTATEGEFEQVVAWWMPNIKITNMPSADQDGVLMDNIEFEAFRKDGKDTIFLAFI